MADLQKRRRVMARSLALGHCICHPRQPCPCPTFKERNLCHCAGEREPPAAGPVALTQLVRAAGCASKLPRQDLLAALAGLPPVDDPRVIVGAAAGDDAGVYQLDDGRCLVQTVDVFTPSVDDPYEFGEIAAANSLSDIYAMGGTPLVALSIIGFPADLPPQVLQRMLAGGIAKMAEAGVPVIGGHTINDPEPKCGFAVTGLVDRDRIITKSAPRAGDRLLLTKPLGTGVLAFAGQIGRAAPEWLAAASESMRALNAAAARVMVRHPVTSCTDVTGFGLLGHLANMLEGTELAAEIAWSRVPFLPGAVELAQAGVLPGGIERNREAVAGRWEAVGLAEWQLDLLCDPQTSGGLLIAVPAAVAPALAADLRAVGCLAAEIGEIRPGQGDIRIVPGESAQAARLAPAPPACTADCCTEEETMSQESAPCCAGGASADPAAAFSAFMAAANAPGAIAAEHKQLMAIALSVLAKCEPCVRIHVKGAQELGIPNDTINEAVWLAVAFGGCPVLMFYRKLGLTGL